MNTEKYFDEWLHREYGLTPNSAKRASFGLSGLMAAWHAAPGERFQARVAPWMLACFGEIIAGDREERNHRFIEEALELIQACGCSASEAHQLVDYVFNRPVGEPHQEVGGVMVTLAALCLANDLDMHAHAETELARVWTKVEAIRAKQAAKPKYSALPIAPPKFLFVAMDDDKRGHQTYCADEAAVRVAVRNAIYFGDAELTPEGNEEVAGITDDLIECGAHHFEGDAPLYLFRLPDPVGDESHHSNLNGGSL
jgi:hypothetical protein